MSSPKLFLEFERSVCEFVLGQPVVVRHMILTLLANGHLLMESVPGLAKTRMVRALAQRLDAKMRRVQFTPDLLPSDVTGAETLQQTGSLSEARFQPGPLFGNVILADEINRAPAKVQAALLEAMEERQVTVAGVSHPMPDLFIVLATQNPIEQEGTYLLPEAQLDRFVMKVVLDYPHPDDEANMLRLLRREEVSFKHDPGKPILSQAAIFDARRQVADVYVSEAIDQYIVALMNATRRPEAYDADLARWIEVGASPRGGIALDRVSRAHAWLSMRDFVTPDDVRSVLHPVLRHRLVLSYDALSEHIGCDQVLDRLLDSVAIPA